MHGMKEYLIILKGELFTPCIVSHCKSSSKKYETVSGIFLNTFCWFKNIDRENYGTVPMWKDYLHIYLRLVSLVWLSASFIVLAEKGPDASDTLQD